ncbi:MAG TPA: metallophosphoesterase [Tepidisphaeraceae bacterium]|jgi:hypothetical protein
MLFKQVWPWVGMLLVIGTFAPIAPAQTAPAQTAPPDHQAISLLGMGDWGTNGIQQKKVAQNMADYVRSSGRTYAGMLLLGDNCYIKLTGPADALWNEMFEQMYDRSVLSFPFYAALGNHDYSNNAAQFELDYAKKNPTSRWKMPAKYYRLDLPVEKPIVTVLMLDSCRDLMTPAEWQAETKWIETELAKPRTTRWLVAAGHHPFFSNGDHGDNGVLASTWGPMFKKANLDFYICGHDHDVQHLEVAGWETSFVLAGGGGAKTRPMRVDNNRRGPFSRSVTGFADIQFNGESAKCRLVSGEGKVIHEFARTRDRKVNITFTTPSDVAVPRTPKSVARPDIETVGTQSTTQPSKVQ